MSPGGVDSFNYSSYIFAYNFSSLGFIAIAVNTYSVRPVINVKVDTGFTSGDGTATSPYVLSQI